MVSANKKRLLIFLLFLCSMGILIKYLFYHSGLLARDEEAYRHAKGLPVVVMVYYETLCPDSKHFIKHQLLPAYRKASALMEVVMLPYGKAQTFTNPDGSYRFDCQHGPTECQGNIYHACSAEAVNDTLQQLEMIACMIADNHNPKEAMYKCAKQHRIENADLIQKCYDSKHGAELVKLYGDATHSLRPAVSFIPTVSLDGSHDRLPIILKDLLGEICRIAGDTDEAKEICSNRG